MVETPNRVVIERNPINYKKWILGIAIILTVFFFVPTYLAGPDGLERVMEDQGIQAPEPIWNGLLTDYTIPGISDPFISSLVAGFIGIGITLALMSTIWFLYKKVNKAKSTSK
ncbi:MAG: hypothetical protein GYA24_12980 [Candidatus Lokiarchaeota archaeon]|nr:hypothetical protein [Candidatus Lokiarchaeota archaeon]